jgi:hypothetical protein
LIIGFKNNEMNDSSAPKSLMLSFQKSSGLCNPSISKIFQNFEFILTPSSVVSIPGEDSWNARTDYIIQLFFFLS